MNRETKRKLMRGLKGKKKPIVNWECPNCGTHYPAIFVQSKDQPYLFCHVGCEEFFDLDGNNVTLKVYPGGKPWEK